jgi:hypothetical protein
MSSWEANSSLTAKEITNSLWSPKIFYNSWLQMSKKFLTPLYWIHTARCMHYELCTLTNNWMMNRDSTAACLHINKCTSDDLTCLLPWPASHCLGVCLSSTYFPLWLLVTKTSALFPANEICSQLIQSIPLNQCPLSTFNRLHIKDPRKCTGHSTPRAQLLYYRICLCQLHGTSK